MLNCVALMGRICNDLELKQTSNGVSVINFNIAVDRSYCKQGEERQADFITIVAWRKTAEFCAKFFSKGQLIALKGSIQTRKYTDREGKKRTAFEVVADEVNFCGKKDEASNNSTYQKPKEPPQNTQPAPDISADDTGDFEEIPSDDDLPFD